MDSTLLNSTFYAAALKKIDILRKQMPVRSIVSLVGSPAIWVCLAPLAAYIVYLKPVKDCSAHMCMVKESIQLIPHICGRLTETLEYSRKNYDTTFLEVFLNISHPRLHNFCSRRSFNYRNYKYGGYCEWIWARNYETWDTKAGNTSTFLSFYSQAINMKLGLPVSFTTPE